MKKSPFLKTVVALILLSSILSLTTCDVFLPSEQDFVTIKRDEWGLIHDTTDHLFDTSLCSEDPTYPTYTFSKTLKDKSIEKETDHVFKENLIKTGTNNEKAYWNTRRIQAAIDHYTARGYKNIRLEQGTYYTGGREGITWSSGTQNWRNPEMIRIQPKHTGLRFDLGGSTLRLEPHDRMESSVIGISSDRTGATTDIKIFNGNIIGDRVNHRYKDEDSKGEMKSHEWGTGINTWGDVRNVEIYNMKISEVTGDCIGANGFNITIRNCEIWRGRRNGIVSVYVNGLYIYNNYIHHIYQAGVKEDTGHFAGFPDSQHEHFGSGIGAEACIAFEHTTNPYFDKQINIKIYNNKLDGQKPLKRTGSSHKWPDRTYYMDNAINFHWATYAVWIYNNEIIGDFEWSCGGSNTLIENNRFIAGYKGHRTSKGLVASGSILETGRSAANYVVIRNNYFKNYNVIVGGASGGVSDSQPHWRHDYAIVDNVFVYNEPRHFYFNDEGKPTSTGYYTGICASVNNSVVLGNVFDVRYAGYYIGIPHPGNEDYAEYVWKPLQCAIYIDVVDSSWERRIPDNLKVDMYISGNTFKGPIWREKHYCYNNSKDLGNAPQYEKFEHSKMPGNYSETNNYAATYAMYQEILKKVTSVGNIWGRTK